MYIILFIIYMITRESWRFHQVRIIITEACHFTLTCYRLRVCPLVCACWKEVMAWCLAETREGDGNVEVENFKWKENAALELLTYR